MLIVNGIKVNFIAAGGWKQGHLGGPGRRSFQTEAKAVVN